MTDTHIADASTAHSGHVVPLGAAEGGGEVARRWLLEGGMAGFASTVVEPRQRFSYSIG